jgi:hypothetical protein
MSSEAYEQQEKVRLTADPEAKAKAAKAKLNFDND